MKNESNDMNSGNNYFISILSDHIRKKKTNPDSEIEWNEISVWANAHQVEGIIYYQCREFMPANIQKEFEQHYLTTIVKFKMLANVLSSITEAFDKRSIPHISVKGIELAYCYPLPPLRTMGDLDILIHKEDKEKARGVLENLGFVIAEDNPDYNWSFWYKGVLIELHHNMLYEETVTVDKQADFFNNYWQYVKNGKLDWDFHFLYLIAHLRKHFINKGAGFRMFMDIAAVVQSKPDLNWSWIEKKLIELDLIKFARVCFGLIECWFGISVPVGYSKLDELFIEEAALKTLTNGLFGFQDKNNQDKSAVNELADGGSVIWIARLRMFMRKLFPSYNNMANSPYYHFVRGRRWLLPIAWGRRIFRLLTNQTESIDDIMNKVMVSKEVINERESELREWGLWE